jgi:FtsH-binding integral membrane protein
MGTDRVGGLAGVAALCALGLAGVAVGICAAWVSRAVWRVGGAALPWGMVVSLAGSVSLVAIARPMRRPAPLVAAASWFVGVVALLVRGDTIVAGDGLGIAFLVIVTAGVVLTASVGGVGS